MPAIRKITFAWDADTWIVQRDKIKLKLNATGKSITLPFRNPIGANIDGSRPVTLVLEVPYAPSISPPKQ